MPKELERLIAAASGIIPDVVEKAVQGLDTVDVDSSWIESVGYEPAMKALKVELKSGQRYTYYNVPQSIYDEIQRASSPGTVINTVIKRGFFPFSRG